MILKNRNLLGVIALGLATRSGGTERIASPRSAQGVSDDPRQKFVEGPSGE